jgi:hypothetical protein
MKIDWVAEVFSAMRDCGEDISIVYGHKSEATTQAEPRWFERPHDEFDGMSGLASLLRAQGFRVEKLPVLRNDYFSFWQGLRGFFAVLPALKIYRRQWRQFDGGRPVTFRSVSKRLAWRLLTEAQTLQVMAEAKSAGVTVNTYLLFHLDAAVSSRLTQPSSSRRWMIPVNLRGCVTRHEENAPHMSFLAVDLHRGESARQIQAQIDSLRARACHWGAWIALHAGKLLGAQGMRRDVRMRERKQHGWTGIFSNLGVWNVPGSGSWIFCPAVWRAQPVGAGCLTMNGRMALSLQLHEGFGADLRTANAVLDDWLQACLPQSAHRPIEVRPSVASAAG